MITILLCITLEGEVYQLQALCFGLSTAPQVFTSVLFGVAAVSQERVSVSVLPG